MNNPDLMMCIFMKHWFNISTCACPIALFPDGKELLEDTKQLAREVGMTDVEIDEVINASPQLLHRS